MTWAVEIVKRVYSVAHTAGNKTMYRLRAWGLDTIGCLKTWHVCKTYLKHIYSASDDNYAGFLLFVCFLGLRGCEFR